LLVDRRLDRVVGREDAGEAATQTAAVQLGVGPPALSADHQQTTTGRLHVVRPTALS